MIILEINSQSVLWGSVLHIILVIVTSESRSKPFPRRRSMIPVAAHLLRLSAWDHWTSSCNRVNIQRDRDTWLPCRHPRRTVHQHTLMGTHVQTSSYATGPHPFNCQSRQQALRALLGREGRWFCKWAFRVVLGKFTSGEWKQLSTSEVQLGLWRSFHRPQDRSLDSAQVVQQLSAGPSKIRMLPRFSGSLWNGNNRLHARAQINQTPDWKEEEEEVNRGVV